MIAVQGEVNIIATVRPIAECLASFVKIDKPDDIKDFCKNSTLATHLFKSYAGLKAIHESNPDSILFIEYNDLVGHMTREMDRISAFIGSPVYAHDPNNIPPSGEVDEVWGIAGLHDVRPVVCKQEYSARKVLGDEIFDYYQGGEFWNDKPEAIHKIDPLDTQLDASIHGNFETAEKLITHLRVVRPDCNRVGL